MEREDSRNYWNDLYASLGSPPAGDGEWLARYGELLDGSSEKPILDLGCGRGADTLYLLERGYPVLSCDISPAALESLRARDSRARTVCFDMREGFPFPRGEFRLVIADLSLHYFPWADTLSLLSEIGGILDERGSLICRVNSLGDRNYGAGKGREVEPHYYVDRGHGKRFFDRADLERLFSSWRIDIMEEVTLGRYGKEKIAWEIVAGKGGVL